MSETYDSIDRSILERLSTQARLTNRELGAAVGLSPNAAGARVQRLIDRGVITGFSAIIDHAALGRPMEASIDLWHDDRRDRDALLKVVDDDDRIVECFHLTGPVDFRIRARVASGDDLNELLERLRSEASIRQTDSRLVLKRFL